MSGSKVRLVQKLNWYKKLKKKLYWIFSDTGVLNFIFFFILNFDMLKIRSTKSDELYVKLVWPKGEKWVIILTIFVMNDNLSFKTYKMLPKRAWSQFVLKLFF